ncbi:uncharacterized protein J4E78_003691 [Alternaria triticimaculans]|uniref:uncharacterized protein n=1 Tax=Alternaria triticimaculans TaxID=297637 RepID=UPI0020C35488|nr:uncharacterized protein J4E78_003691 [Alternaria triticimaculans]KAI4663280.1 hypothetical protein J4E78_003691 [Alternaria triticimaculans]
MPRRNTSKFRAAAEEDFAFPATPSASSPGLPNANTTNYTYTPSPWPSPSSSSTSIPTPSHFHDAPETPTSSPPPPFSSTGKATNTNTNKPSNTSASKAKHAAPSSPSPPTPSRLPRTVNVKPTPNPSPSTSTSNLLSSRIASYEARTASARSPTRGAAKGRSTSVDPTLMGFGKYYDAATKKFCVGNGEGGDRDIEEESEDLGERRGRSQTMIRDTVEQEEEHVVLSKIPSVAWPPGVFPPGFEAGNRRDAKKLLGGEKDGVVAVSPSVAPSDSWFASPDAGQEEEAREYWDDVLAHVNEAGDDALREKKQVLGYPSDNMDYHRSKMPARNEHSEPTEFSERKANRDKVMQVLINSVYPKHKVEGGIFDNTEVLNEDRRKRAICIDDPDADASPPPTCDRCEYVTLPLHERLRNKLPSPSVFTPWTYRSKYHELRAVEMASMSQDLPLKDDSLKARGMHYDSNRAVLEAALEEDRILRKEPHVVDALRCHYGHNLKAPGNMSCGTHHPRMISDVDTMQYLLLGQQELRRDIERLECVRRAVGTSISTVRLLPTRYRGQAKGKVLGRMTAEEHLEELARKALMVDDNMSDVPVDEPFPVQSEQYRTSTSLDTIVESPPRARSMSVGTALYVTEEYTPFVEQPRPRQNVTSRSSSVYSGSAAKTKRSVSIPPALPGLSETSDAGECLPREKDRASKRIMQSIRSFHNRGRSRPASSAGSESSRTGRREERGRREGVVTSPTRQDEERYPKRQNIVQQ